MALPLPLQHGKARVPELALRLRGGGHLDEFFRLSALVESENACALPGCNIKYDCFVTVLRRAMSRGYVKDCYGNFVLNGLRHGFDIGADRDALKGRRVFKNYLSAYAGASSISTAISSRLAACKTICLGRWSDVLPKLNVAFADYYVFPMAAVPKPHEPTVLRPVSDHTKTGFNAHTVLGILGHSLDTFKRVSWLLKRDYFMYVSDVADAFVNIPLAPWLWVYMFFRWFEPTAQGGTAGDDVWLYAHLFGDFGTRGLPGTWKIFLVDVVINMARSEFVITLSIEIYVDDSALIGPVKDIADGEMAALQTFTSETCGIKWKWLKDKAGSQLQLYIGFWWDSRDFTLCLDEIKLRRYLADFAEAGMSASRTLRERQSTAGKLQRAIRTLPPGAACLLVNCYRMMCGLTLPWQRRRTSQVERSDYLFVHDLLKLNGAKGYYSYDGFKTGPTCYSDAFKRQYEAGGGYFSSDGFYDHYTYCRSAARKPIDELEGDTVLRCCETLCARWRGCQVPFGIDNSSFERSAAKGRSNAQRLNDLLRHLFMLQIRYAFVLQPFWLSSEDNFLADDLSRGRVDSFLARVHEPGYLAPGAFLFRHPQAGRVVMFGGPDARADPMTALRQLLKSYSSNYTGDGPSRVGDAQHISVPYLRASIFTGLAPEFLERIDEVMDSRLAPSSNGKMVVAYRRWEAFARTQGWSPLIVTDDPARGGKLASWVLSMLDDTELVFKSIATYVWGVRVWHTLQHEADPIYGVMHWKEFMAAIAVLTAVPGEPREEVPFDVLSSILQRLDMDKFEDVNFGLALLCSYFTFSRTECPCPKAYTGPTSLDPAKHWLVGDFKLVRMSGVWVLWIRFKSVKQDSRLERPEAAHASEFLPFDSSGDTHGRDWVAVGDVPDVPHFSVARFYMRHAQLLGRERAANEPMFLSRDQSRPYIYPAYMMDFRNWLHEVDANVKLGPHGLRVRGYNDAKNGVGDELTQVHGGWRSAAHARYARFNQRQVLGIPAAMIGVRSVHDAQREVSRARTVRGGTLAADVAGDSSEDEAEAGAPAERAGRPPEGYAREDRVTAAGRKYAVYRAPDGRILSSQREAWRHYLGVLASAPAEPVVSSPAASEAGDSASAPATASRRGNSSISPRRGARAVVTASVSFPDDLTTHVVEFERPSARPLPARRM